jgi:uncharacterized NAD(P)/FAD-binding protein YdhS
MHCIESDLDIAYQKGVHIGDTYYQLSDLVVELLNALPEKEQKHFYNVYGMKFTKLIRRAGADYRDMAEGLMQAGIVELVRGRLEDLVTVSKGKTLRVSYASAENGSILQHPLLFPLVVNCTGFEDLPHSSSTLIRNLVEKKLCTINSTQRGFEVNEEFEANKGLFVVGPLLGGIFNSRLRYWHVENARRIFIAGSMVAEILANLVLSHPSRES